MTLDGAQLSPAAMLTALNKVAGENGIGRIDIVESRFVGKVLEHQQQAQPSRAILVIALNAASWTSRC